MLNTEMMIKDALIQTLNLDDDTIIQQDLHLQRDLHLQPMETLMFLIKLEEMIDGFYVDPDTFKITDLETVSSITHYVNRQLRENQLH